jgi:uncharacterized membrane protein YqhA
MVVARVAARYPGVDASGGVPAPLCLPLPAQRYSDMNSLLQYLVRGIGLMASLGLFLLTLVVTAYAFIEGGLVVAEILQSSDPEYSVIYNAMKVVDLFLLGFSILIASVGIYELFVGVLPNMPGWLRIEDLDSLKGVLIKTVIVVLGISFMGRAVTWDGQESLLGYGVAIGAVVAALSFFLSVKGEMDKKSEMGEKNM